MPTRKMALHCYPLRVRWCNKRAGRKLSAYGESFLFKSVNDFDNKICKSSHHFRRLGSI